MVWLMHTLYNAVIITLVNTHHIASYFLNVYVCAHTLAHLTFPVYNNAALTLVPMLCIRFLRHHLLFWHLSFIPLEHPSSFAPLLTPHHLSVPTVV